jgi:hypothetical protein
MLAQRIIDRAWRAYLAADGVGAEQPNSARVETLDGLRYAVLANSRRTLAVYRITNRGNLSRLKRWPMALNTAKQNPVGSANTRNQVGADAHSIGDRP